MALSRSREKADLNKAVEAERTAQFLLAEPEKKALRWMAARLPKWVLPDDLTILGIFAAIGICAGYQLSNEHLWWLWVVDALLIVHWFGDSLDGTLARVRKIERPRYGYYVDHLVDAISTALIGLGLGLSPFMLLSIAGLIVVAYLIVSINVYLESYALGRFNIGYGYFGPTELRILLFVLNAALALDLGLDFNLVDLDMTIFDVFGLAVAGVIVTLLVFRAVKNLRELAREEPAAPRR
jgi:phosphatidylglycerophosphate synthase